MAFMRLLWRYIAVRGGERGLNQVLVSIIYHETNVINCLRVKSNVPLRDIKDGAWPMSIEPFVTILRTPPIQHARKTFVREWASRTPKNLAQLRSS